MRYHATRTTATSTSTSTSRSSPRPSLRCVMQKSFKCTKSGGGSGPSSKCGPTRTAAGAMGCATRSNASQGAGSALRPRFWLSRPVWKRSLVNTTRCLVGCTAGDFSAMWYLQSCWPDLGMGPTMGISMACGITTSLMLETTLLRYGRDDLPWLIAARTAAAMSFISMITMELAENIVDYNLTGGVVDLSDPWFWVAAGVSTAAGLIAPLPYNYHRLRRYGKACH
ncbi:hypothetical protein GMORB2_0222 [Geosmithia morbida]|uniref:DUF4396 domain-containing protein n=1 Tax=Geosmithia morbida TaxID=1094350 RepID=A0A9P4Z0K1_9HYPO|nr:uncharacterized protein GMORB2_0222 [Geosmithia morbida]KAF4126486.1 hypothetical protein GMORB2_0222 [Geosmithia morbida]